MDKSTEPEIEQPAPFWTLLETTLQFELVSGGISPLTRPHTMDWRTLPCAVCVVMQTGKMLLELDGGRRITVGAGHGFFVPPGVHYRNSLLDSSGHCCWVHLNFTIFEGVNLFSLLTVPLDLPPAVAGPCSEAMVELIRIRRNNRPSLHAAVRKKTFGLMLLMQLFELADVQQNAQQFAQFSRRVAPALAQIHRRLDAPISVETLARQAHLSPSRFHDVFRNAIGVAPRDYIQRLRLQSAQRLLLGTDLAIREIAQRTGHNDPFYFSRHFRRHTGMSPLQYRRQVRKGFEF